ncbi:MAG: AAA family ATPase [Candidatus Jordarchaeum sp.]|uniref:AAA family ATPase n=1 Tax=Candidatus Jordarchaeum sp. TaxID=2823881 RepID=UPI004049873F
MRKVIGLVGMPGSGKTLAVNIAKKMGIPVVAMGDVVRDEVKMRGLEETPYSVGKVSMGLRKEEGEQAVAIRTLNKIEREKTPVILVEGIRSLEEIELFKKHYPDFTLIAIHSSPKTRFKRLYERQRLDDTKDLKTFQERDARELNYGIGSAIAQADYLIVNEGSEKKLIKNMEKILEEITK